MDTKDLINWSNLKDYSTENIIAELKLRGLGIFNLSLPFHYTPKDEDGKN